MPAEQRGSAYRTSRGWGIRWYELDGRRACQAGFATKSAARRYFDEQVRPRLLGGSPDMTLAELVDAYLDAHAVGREPRTIRTLRERLKYATDRFGDVKLTELERNPRLIATWMRTLPVGSRYGIVQALRQTLETAIRSRMISENPAKLAGRNPEPRREHVDPFEHTEVDRLAVDLGPYGPLIVFAAETGLRPSEWMALERRDVDRPGAAVSVERTYAAGRVKTYGKTMAARRRVPLSSRAQSALDRIPARVDTPLLFPSPNGEYIDLSNFRAREWRPALHPAPPHLRPAPHLRQPRTRSPDLHLRTGALHGHLGAHDRPHLRPPRPRLGARGEGQARRLRESFRRLSGVESGARNRPVSAKTAAVQARRGTGATGLEPATSGVTAVESMRVRRIATSSSPISGSSSRATTGALLIPVPVLTEVRSGRRDPDTLTDRLIKAIGAEEDLYPAAPSPRPAERASYGPKHSL